jgi:hypothetical protein
MRDLDGYHALRSQKVGHASDEVVELRHLRQNIVGDDQVRVPMLGDDLSRGFGAEECRTRWDAPGASRYAGSSATLPRALPRRFS